MMTVWQITPFDTWSTTLADGPDHPYRIALAAWLEVLQDRFESGAALAERANGEYPGDPILAGLSMMVSAMAGYRSIDHELLDRLASIPAEHDEELVGLVEVANWHTFADRYPDAGRLLDRQIARARRIDDVVALVGHLCCRAELDLRRGRWGQAAAAVAEAIERSEMEGMPTAYAHVLAARLSAYRGESDDCARHLRETRRVALALGDESSLWRARAVEGLACLGAAQPDRAVDWLLPLHGGSSPAGGALGSVRWWDGDLVEALVRVGRSGEAASMVDRLRTRWPQRWDIALASRHAALLDPDGASAGEHAQRAAAGFAAIGAPFERARSLLVGGEAARRARQITVARSALVEAVVDFEALGAAPWLDRARRELRACGSVDVTDGDRRPLDLTAQEHQIVEAIHAGLTNKEIGQRVFLSVKTVEAHLTRIYRKYAVTSRSQLVAALRQSTHPN